MKKSSVALGGAILAGVVALGGSVWMLKYHRSGGQGGHAGGFEPAEAVEVVPARVQTYQPMADLVGTIVALRSVTLSNEVAGTVTSVGFESGAVVEAGRVLLTLDDAVERAELASLEASVKVSEADIAMSEASLRLAESNARRMDEASASNAASAMDADRARTETETARAMVTKMKAELEQARARADRLRAEVAKKTIRAPFRARAGLRNIHPGQYLKEGSEIVSLQGLDDEIYLDFALPQEQAAKAREGMVVTASSQVLGSEPVQIRVVAFESYANPDTRNIRVRSVIANRGAEQLRPGMSVDISVPVGESERVVVVPDTAVRRSTFGDRVFVVAPSTKDHDPPGSLRAVERPVRLGPAMGGVVVIVSGLQEGEKVAASGSFKLRPDALVTAISPGMGTASSQSSVGGEAGTSSVKAR